MEQLSGVLFLLLTESLMLLGETVVEPKRRNGCNVDIAYAM